MNIGLTAPLLATGLLLTLVGCGSREDDSEAESPGEASSSATTTSSPVEAVALEGTWRTDPITIADMADTLRAAGLGDSVGGFKQNAPISAAPTVLTLSIGDDWDLLGRTRGGEDVEIDYDADYSVTDDEVVVSHSEGSNTFRWSVRDDVLQLTWLETTFEDSTETPEEVFQRALYMTADFHRTS